MRFLLVLLFDASTVMKKVIVPVIARNLAMIVDVLVVTVINQATWHLSVSDPVLQPTWSARFVVKVSITPTCSDGSTDVTFHSGSLCSRLSPERRSWANDMPKVWRGRTH